MWLIVIKLNQIKTLLFEVNQLLILFIRHHFLEKIVPSQMTPSHEYLQPYWHIQTLIPET